jgi:uncharacterized protein YrrD
MKRYAADAFGSVVHAIDGMIGKVTDFYFDDHRWTIRYIVADTGDMHKVLLSPLTLKRSGWETNEFIVDLTVEQVKNSPDMDTDKPISRQHEIELQKYYNWPVYWEGISGYYGIGVPITSYIPAVSDKQDEPAGDPHLRSVAEVTGYRIHSTDGEIGHLEDFLIDDKSLVIKYMLVNIRNLPHGKKVLISPARVKKISWDDSDIYVTETREVIKNSPEFDYTRTVSPDYETKLHEYYEHLKDNI